MAYTPSIVLEGASRAADWIPFAKTMLNGMVGDGTRNSSPEDGITIVITRHGSVAKIYIRAEYPEGFKFAGVPYTGVNTSGWGSPYDEDNPKGTPGSYSNRDVIIEKTKGVFTAKRYPAYNADYPDLQYGNMDWTSSDGKTVLTWKGPNSGQTCEMSYHRQVAGYCCSENQPTNNWHAGYHYPGFVHALSYNCNLVVYIPQKITAVDSQEPTEFQSELFLGSDIYMDGELLVSVKVAGDYINDQATDDAMFVYGAAIQKVTEEDGSTTEYLVAMLSGYTVVTSQNTSFKSSKDYLYRAPMDDLTDFELTNPLSAFDLTGAGHNTDAPWSFNSTGTEAVTVRGQTGDVYKIVIADNGTATGDRIWKYSDSGIFAIQDGYHSPLDFGEINRWDAKGSQVLGVGFKGDKVRYAMLYTKMWEEVGITLDDPGVGCDTLTYRKEYDMQGWFAFVDDPHAMNEQYPGAIKAYDRHEIFTEDTLGGTDGTVAIPAIVRTTDNKANKKHPIFIDCRYDTVLFHNINEPRNSFSYGLTVAFGTFLMDDLASPQFYTSTLDFDLHIEGIVAYESATFTQQRHPGDCFKTSIYSLSSGKDCDQTGYRLHLTGDLDGDNLSPADDSWFEAYNVAAFCNIHIHKVNPDKPDFDILFTARTKYSDPDAPSDSFVAHWDGEALINRQDAPTLLDIDEDGVIATTGKI